MPHLTLEYTDNLLVDVDFGDLFARVHAVLAEAGIRIGNCKSRAVRLDTYRVGDGEPVAFVHADLRLLEGRSPDVKRQIGERVLDILKERYDPQGSEEIQITVETRDISRDAYFKIPAGTLAH
jgi:5-carboxymethyl-2-hydroxymuconate isomerase